MARDILPLIEKERGGHGQRPPLSSGNGKGWSWPRGEVVMPLDTLPILEKSGEGAMALDTLPLLGKWREVVVVIDIFPLLEKGSGLGHRRLPSSGKGEEWPWSKASPLF